MKKTLSLLMLLMALLLTGCTADAQPQPPVSKDFAAAGMTITLDETFAQSDHVSYTALFSSQDLVVMALKEEYTLFENTDYSADSSLEEYAGLVWSANQMVSGMTLQSAEGLHWFEYDDTVNGRDYTYRAYVFKSHDAFWLVQFSTFTERFPDMTDTIHGFAKTIAFGAA